MPSTTKTALLGITNRKRMQPKSMKLQFYVWIFFRLIGTTWKKVQLGLTLQLKSSLLTAWVLGRFRLWGHTTNLITIVSGILHRGERTRQQQPKGLYANCAINTTSQYNNNPLTQFPFLYFRGNTGQLGKFFLHNSGSILVRLKLTSGCTNLLGF